MQPIDAANGLWVQIITDQVRLKSSRPGRASSSWTEIGGDDEPCMAWCSSRLRQVALQRLAVL